MATLAIQTINKTGLNPTYVAAGVGGDKVRPGRGVFLHVLNADDASVTVTLVTPIAPFGLALADRLVTVPAGAERMIAIPADEYSNPADSGLAAVTYSGVTDLTVAALRI